MRSITAFCAAAVLTLGVAGCAGSVAYRGSAGYSYSQPTLVAIGPDLWVVENYERPIFYSDGYYWRYDNRTWYRSYRGDSAWVRVDYGYVPHTVARIDRPHRYVHYRAPRGYVRRTPPGWYHDRDRTPRRGGYYR